MNDEIASAAFAPTAHASQPSLLAVNLVGLLAIVRKEIQRVMRIWVQTIVPPAITMTLYFVIFGTIVGRRIGEMDGVPFTTFIAPGLIMMSVITTSFGNTVSSFFSAKLQLYLEEMLVAPLSFATIVLGYMAGGVVRALAVACIVTALAMFFTDLKLVHPLMTISIIVLTAMVFSLAGLINAILAKKFDDVSIVPTFVLTPLTYLGGVFFSISLLSPAWQKVALANPVLYMVNGFRFGMLGISDIPVAAAYTVILVFFTVLFATTMVLFKRGVGIRQ